MKYIVVANGKLGYRMAYMQIRHILCRLVMNFNMELMPESTNWPDMKAHLVWHMHALNVKLSHRIK